MTKWTLLAIGAVALAACGQQAQQAETQQPSGYETPAAPQAAAMTDAQFVQVVANMDAFEIQASQLAAQRAARQEVKDIATTVISTNQASTRELTQLAPTLSITAPTAELDSSQTATLHRLQGATGEAFDDAYLDAQVEAHETTVRTMERYVETASAGPLRDWAQNALPAAREQLERVQTLENAT